MATKAFAEVVKQAQDEGYTEPDPRLDLSGTDVMRKIMILAREAGEQLEMEDISNNSFMPHPVWKALWKIFIRKWKSMKNILKRLYQKAVSSR